MEREGLKAYEVDERIRKQLKPFKDEVNAEFKELREKYNELNVETIRGNAILEHIAANTGAMKENYIAIKEYVEDYGPRLTEVEKQYGLKEITEEGKWKMIVALLSGTGLLGLIITIIMTQFGGFPFQ